MIKRVLPLIWLVLVCLSCKSAPPAGEAGEYEDTGGPSLPGPEAGGPALPDPEAPVPAEEAPELSEIPSVAEPPEELPQAPEAVVFLEPPPELAEAVFPEVPPEEGEISPVLPEPLPADLPPEPEAPPPGAPPDGSSDDLPGADPAPAPVVPPPFIRPAEPPPPPVPDREPVPVPVNPLPDLPARIPPAGETGETVTYSRTLRALVGQVIEVPFRGTGWVYLGEENSKRGIRYMTRRLDPEGLSFIFRAEEAGTYVLKFYRQDFIRDFIINDHVRLIIEDGPALPGEVLSPDRVIAEPRWPELPGTEPPVEASPSAGTVPPEETAPAPEPAPALGTAPAGGTIPAPEAASAPEAAPAPEAPAGGTAPATEAAASPGTGSPLPLRPVIRDEGIVPVAPAAAAPRERTTEATAELSPDSLPEDYIALARREYEAGRVREALAVLDQFRERFPLGSDEAWWLYGQILEANSPLRNIRSSLEYYRRLVREYPQSPRYAAARQRIAYLEQYYLNIR